MLPAAVSLARTPAPPVRPPLARPAPTPAPLPRFAARPATRLNTQVGAAPAGLPDRVIQLVNAPGPGDPLPPAIRLTLEQSLDVPLAPIRVHTDARTAEVVESIGARAFTYGIHIFIGPRERPTDLTLMAHEVTHVVQQQGRPPQVQLFTSRAGDAFEREANSVAAAARHGARAQVRERTGGPQVQTLGLSDILDGLADLAANVPGFTLLTVIIGRNPINLRVVERNFTNLLRGFMGLIPGGEILFQVLNRYGVVERIGNWVSEQVNALGINYDYLRGRFTAFTDSLSWTDIFSPGDVWRRAQNIFSEPITRIRNFISRLVSQAITWLKETFMQPLSNFCREIPGYTLVTVLLGRDPFTNASVPRTALNVVRAFAEFIPGGTEKVNQLVESRALERAYAWFTQETQARNLTWDRVTGTFAQAWNSLRLEDVLHPIDTLQRMITLFRPLMSDLVSFAGAALMQLLEFIYEAAMGAGGARILAIIKRARDTFFIIIRDPVGFLRNLLGAVGRGVRQFMNNILRHLRDGVIAWLTGPVAQAGIQIPEQWDLRGIIWFVLQILGLTWDRIRQKLVRLMGERAVAMLEAGFQLIRDIRERGLVQALRDRVTEFFGQLREAALGSIRTFIQQRLVMAGITQLLSLLNPVGAVIQAIIKTYTTIQFFIQRINQILDLVESIVNSIAAIAAGAIGPAANFVERTMARTIPIILDFLARFIGLGDVGAHVQRTIRGLQARVDQMLDRAVDWIRRQASRLGSAIVSGARSVAGRLMEWWRTRKQFTATDRSSHSLYFQGQGAGSVLTVSTTPVPVNDFLDRIRTAATSSTDSTVRTNYQNATALARQIDRLRATVESGPNPRQPADIDTLNSRMEDLANLLPPLLPLAFPAPATSTGSPVNVGELILITSSNLVALVTGINAASVPGVLMVNFRIISPRHERSRTSLAVGFPTSAFGREFTRYTADPRELYLGSTPNKNSAVGRQVKTRMQREGKFRIHNGAEQILYSRDGNWWNVSDCDMGHVIDAVTWWNSNGRLTGARSAAVISFMNDPDNYELEPSGPNQARGAALAARGIRYLPPAV